jgi:hypothetical protein
MCPACPQSNERARCVLIWTDDAWQFVSVRRLVRSSEPIAARHRSMGVVAVRRTPHRLLAARMLAKSRDSGVGLAVWP